MEPLFKEADNKIIKLSEKIMALRKRPLLILDLENVAYWTTIRLENELKGKKLSKLDVLLNAPMGGRIEPAFNIVKLIRKHAEAVEMIIPYRAKSAGTLICLGADKLLMNTTAELGPLDTQNRIHKEEEFESTQNIFKALEQIQQHALDGFNSAITTIKKRNHNLKIDDVVKLAAMFSGQTCSSLYNKIDPEMLGEYARLLEMCEKYVFEVLIRYAGRDYEDAKKVTKKLVYGYPNHNFIIDIQESEKLGLPAEEVSDDIKEIIDDLKIELREKDLTRQSFLLETGISYQEKRRWSLIKLLEYPTKETPEKNKPVQKPKETEVVDKNIEKK
ncbi:MAG: hypothetical protein WCO84_02505 [bacterium]